MIVRRVVLCALLLVASIAGGSAQLKAPDFAYPKKVEKNAEAAFKIAMSGGDEIAALRALMDMTLARTAVDEANAQGSIDRLKEMESQAKSPVVKALVNMLLAEFYDDIYSAASYKYNERQLPREPLSADFNEWSGEQFASTIFNYIKAAMADKASLQQASLKDYAEVVTVDKRSPVYYPTLYDFMAMRAIDLLGNNSYLQQRAGYMPEGMLRLYPACAGVPAVTLSPAWQYINDLYNSLLAMYSDNAAPYLNYSVMRMAWAQDMVARGGHDDVEKMVAEEYRRLYDAFSNSEYSGDLLIAMRYVDSDDSGKWLYERCNENISRYPAYYRIDNLRDMVVNLSARSVRTTYPRLTSPRRPIDVALTAANVNSCVVKVYRVDNDKFKDDVAYGTLAALTPVKEVTVDIPGQVPFKTDTVVKVSVDDFGKYVIVAAFDGCGEPYRDATVDVVYSTGILLGVNYYKDSYIMAVNPLTGKPLKDVKLEGRENGSRSRVFTGTTDSNGLSLFSCKGWANVVGSDGSSVSAPLSLYGSDYSVERDATLRDITIFTSLGIYHPGDSVEWSIVTSKATIEGAQPVSGCEVKVSMFDANGQSAGETTVVTDRFGRASGSFATREGLLTGQYSLRAQATESGRSFGGWKSFTVSDYKLPTYEIVNGKVLKNYPDSGAVTLRGVVKTYSGFPMGDVPVKMSLSVMPRWRWWDNGTVELYTAPDVMTDADGNYEITVPVDVMRVSPYPGGRFTATLTAVSQAGESQQTKADFSLTPAVNIMAGLDSDVVNASETVELSVKVIDNEEQPVDTCLTYTLSNDRGVAASGKVVTGDNSLDWNKVTGGVYRLSLYCGEDSVALNNITVYRPDDKLSPSDDVLWTPASAVEIASGEKPRVLVGTSGESTPVLVTVWNTRGAISQRWVTLKRGLHWVDVEDPVGDTPFNVSLQAVNGFRISELKVSMTPAKAMKNLKMEISSFRDKLLPGTSETWQFRIVNQDGDPVQSAVVLDMYNKALDNLVPNKLSLRAPVVGGTTYSTRMDDPSAMRWFSLNGPRGRNYKYVAMPAEPVFNLYGMPLYGGYSRGGRLYMTNATVNLAGSAVKYELAEDEVADKAAPALAENKVRIRGSRKEASVETTADGGVEAGATEAETDSYRPSEVALGFFSPMLTTDAGGNLSYTFTVPDANSTWQLSALAYSPEMLIASDYRQVVTSKPLMVQSNLPRFLRVGDDAVLQATVMNNTDSLSMATTTIELFNPANGKVIKSVTYENRIEPMRSVTLSLTTGEIGDDIMLGYRIKASNGVYSDGEQAAVPVLSTITPVIETKTFYSAPDSMSISVRLPDAKGIDDRMTLQFTENPLWTVVTALPGLREKAPSTATSAADAIYSASIASWIVRNNPEVATALRYWTQSDRSDSTLVSMLQRNADLKTLLLEATPWMVDAMNDTERMQRLALIFDKDEVDKVLKTSIDILSRSVAKDGGWKWYPGDTYTKDASRWATEHVLTLMGYLRAHDAMPADRQLGKMIDNAIVYLDREVAAEYAMYPGADYSYYAYLRTLYSDVRQSTAAKRVSNAAVQSILGGWKRHSSMGKAIDALILYRSNYQSTAGKILKSLREYAIYTPAGGMTWKQPGAPYGSVLDNAVILTAFATVDSGCDDIDKIRQWLILQKEAMNWGTSNATSAAIHAILTTSPSWQRQARGSRFYLGDTEFTPAVAPEAYTGYLRTALPVAEAAGKTLTIAKGGATPAYGAVYCQYQARMDSVAAASCDAVSVEKRFYLLNSDGTWRQATGYAVGDRVKIELLIKTTRDMDYVAVTDDRAACLEPVEQLPTPIWSEGICFYRENLDSSTRMFISRLPRGAYLLSYEMFVNNSGRFTSGIATVQSQYAPQMSAHSSGTILNVD